MKETHRTLMAVGAHPDDADLACGGTLAAAAAAGHRTVILDLTRGEMGSFGGPVLRRREARRAAGLLGAAARENLDLGDAALEATLPCRHLVAAAIRRHRPDLILAPHRDDRHPDHAAAGRIVRAAVFDARLASLDIAGRPFAVPRVLYYPAHDYVDPSLVVDITPFFRKKMAAMRAFASQFGPARGKRSVAPIGFDDYLWEIETRARHLGSLVGVKYGEGFLSVGPVKVSHADGLFEEEA